MVSGSDKVAPSSLPAAGKLSRVANWVLLLVIAAACIIILRKSFLFIDTAPFMNPDDSIPNVAVSLAQHGRYGFLSSPTQGLHDVDRTHAFFNYGPLYFYVAAALTWLIGPSLPLYRMLHPAGIVFIVLASIWAFKRISLLGTALLAVMIFDIYLTSQWPLARPDIMVSVCGALMLIFAARAIHDGGWLNWFGMGFFASSAVTTHQIAAAMIPAAGVIWAWSVLAERSRRAGTEVQRSALGSFGALFMGGAAGVLIYLLAIDFRLKDLWILGTAGMKIQPTPYLEAVHKHFDYAWASWPQIWRRSTEAAFLGAFLLVIGGWFLTGPVRRRILAFVMPPVVAALMYQLSLGFYGNQHTGYVILSQVTTLWAVAAMLAVGVAWLRDRGSWGRALELAATAGAIWMLATAGAAWARTPSMWQIRAVGNTDISDYIRQVVAPLPERAAVWGSLYFGLDAGDRTDLVQFGQVWTVLRDDFRPEQRAELAPDFLALSSYELDTDAIRSIARYDTTIENFGKLFPGVRYRLVNLVSAPPFGVTREYERLAASQPNLPASIPGIAVNDGTGRQWSGALSAPLDVKFSPAEPVTVNVSIYSLNPERAALNSVVADLPPGFFLIDVDLGGADSDLAGFILATPGQYFYWRGNWTDFSMPAAPYMKGDRNVWVLVDHLGGPLYLSRFENPPSGAPSRGIRVSSVRRVAALMDHTGRLKPLTLPAWTAWQSRDKGVSSHADESGSLRLTGTADADAWLIQTPPILVPANERLALSLPTEPMSGGVEVGVMDSKGSWLAPPTLMPRRIVFDTGTATSVTIIVANSHLGPARRLDVFIKPGTLMPVAPGSEYVDRVMGCRSPYIHLADLDCVKK